MANGAPKVSWMNTGIITSIVLVGVWVGTIRADIDSKADKAKVEANEASVTEILKRIEGKLDDVNKKVDTLDTSVEKVDERQRTISQDVAMLKAKSDR